MSNPQCQIPYPQLLEGNSFSDNRGKVTFNNDFDASQIKRIYTIENHSLDFIRGWQGHKVEQRWFTVVFGSFIIKVITIDDFSKPNTDLEQLTFNLSTDNFTILHVPAGNITVIQSLEANSKLLVMSDYLLGEIQDEYRFPLDFFKVKS